MGNSQQQPVFQLNLKSGPKQGTSLKDQDIACNCCSSTNKTMAQILHEPKQMQPQAQSRLVSLQNEILLKITQYLELEDIHRLQTTCRSLIQRDILNSLNVELYMKRKFSFKGLDSIFKDALAATEVHIDEKSLFEFVQLIKQDKGSQRFFKYVGMEAIARQTEEVFRVSKIKLSNFQYQEDQTFNQSQFQERMLRRSKEMDSQLESKFLSADQLKWLDNGYVILELIHLDVTETIVIECLDDAKQGGQEIPKSIKDIHFVLHEAYRICSWVEKILKYHNDDRRRIMAFILFWQHYNTCADTLNQIHQHQFREVRAFNQGTFGYFKFDKFQPTLEKALIKLWSRTLMQTLTVQSLNYNFDTIFLNTLKSNFSNSQYRQSVEYCDETKLLEKYVNSLLDLSVNQLSISWLGHSQAKLIPQLHELLDLVYDHVLQTISDIQETPFEEIFSQFRNIMVFLNDIFPLWIVDQYFEIPIAVHIQSQLKKKVDLRLKIESPNFRASYENSDEKDVIFSQILSNIQSNRNTRTTDTTRTTTGYREVDQSEQLRQNIIEMEKNIDILKEDKESIRDFSIHSQDTLQRIEQRDMCLRITNQVNRVPLQYDEKMAILADNFSNADAKQFLSLYDEPQQPDSDEEDNLIFDLEGTYKNMADLINTQFFKQE